MTYMRKPIIFDPVQGIRYDGNNLSDVNAFLVAYNVEPIKPDKLKLINPGDFVVIEADKYVIYSQKEFCLNFVQVPE